MTLSEQDLVFRLQKRAEIRRQIATRRSVQNGEPDRIADLLEEAALEITNLRELMGQGIQQIAFILELVAEAKAQREQE